MTPTPPRPWGHSAPTAKKRLAIAMPTAPDSSRASRDQVMMRSRLPDPLQHFIDPRDRHHFDPGNLAAGVVCFWHDRRREAELRRFAQPVLAALDGPHFACQSDFAEHDQLLAEGPVAHRREDRDEDREVRGRL